MKSKITSLVAAAIAFSTPVVAKECFNGKVVASIPAEGYTAPGGTASAQAKPEGTGHVDIAQNKSEGNGHVDIAQAKPEGNGHVDLASAQIGDACK